MTEKPSIEMRQDRNELPNLFHLHSDLCLDVYGALHHDGSQQSNKETGRLKHLSNIGVCSVFGSSKTDWWHGADFVSELPALLQPIAPCIDAHRDCGRGSHASLGLGVGGQNTRGVWFN